jgi:uncharacterized protein
MTTHVSKQAPLKIILDSNALFVPLQFKIDIFSDLEILLNRNIELILLSAVNKELKMLTKKSSPEIAKQAKFALSLAKKCTFVKMPEKRLEPTDDAILRIAEQWNSPVFTNDKALKKKLRDISVPVIYVRQKSRLEIDGLIS